MKRSKDLSLNLLKEIMESSYWNENLDILEVFINDSGLKTMDFFKSYNDIFLNVEQIKYLEGKGFNFIEKNIIASHTGFQYETEIGIWIAFLSHSAQEDIFNKDKGYQKVTEYLLSKTNILNETMKDIKNNKEIDCFSFILSLNCHTFGSYELLLTNKEALKNKGDKYIVNIEENILAAVQKINYNKRNEKEDKIKKIQEMQSYLSTTLNFDKYLGESLILKTEVGDFLFKNNLISQEAYKQNIKRNMIQNIEKDVNNIHQLSTYDIDKQIIKKENKTKTEIFLEKTFLFFQERCEGFMEDNKKDFFNQIEKSEIEVEFYKRVLTNFDDIFYDFEQSSFLEITKKEIEKKILNLQVKENKMVKKFIL